MVAASNLEDLSINVNIQISKGYKPQGSVINESWEGYIDFGPSSRVPTTKYKYTQPMMRNK